MSRTPPTTPGADRYDGSDDDSDLRRLLHEAVADVHPSGGPGQVRARSARPASAASRWLPAAAAAAVAVLVIGGTAWWGQRDSGATPAADGTTGRTEGRTVDVPVYVVGRTAAGPRLFTETRRVAGTTDSELQVAMQEAVTGTPRDDDYLRWTSDSDATVTATADDTEVTVDLGALDARTLGSRDEQARVRLQALVWTATAATSSELPVRFLVDGESVEELLGTDTSEPVRRSSADSVLSAVSITSPTQGEQVPGTFEVRGEAAAYEANVVWELRRGSTVVREGFATAEECCTLAPYSFKVSAPPGTYTLVVRDTDESDGEGIGTTEDSKDIEVE